jgi:threonine dehydratase
VKDSRLPELNDIIDAYQRIKDIVHKTPVMTSSSINEIIGAELFFKCENLQKIGAFKFRGAINAVFSLDDEKAKKGVATHSSGNHAQALALAARMRCIPATIVMPDNSPIVKINAVKGYGGEIIFCKPTLEARETTLNRVISEKGSVFIHPYNNFNVICGQGTSAFELIKDYPDLDIVMCPVGGGGLLSGTATSVKGLNSNIKVIAAEPEGADDACRSFKAGKIIPSIEPKTIADGLLTSLGELTFAVIKERVDDIITVSDDSIRKAMKLIWERMKIIVEPSAAVTLAVLIENKVNLKGKKIGLILSGGNIDFEKFVW